jgi:hypothetical protein
MKWTQIESGSVYAAGHQLLTALGEEADGIVTRINSDPAFVERLAKFAICGGFDPSTSQTRAREIMSKNMFGVEEAIKHFGASPTRPQLAALSEIPFSEEVLQQCKDTHVLVAVLPLSIVEIWERVQGKGLFRSQDWYNSQSFAKDKGDIGWQLVRKTEVPGSTNKNWSEQQALLGKDEETLSAQVMAYTIIGQHLATGERLFEHIYVRTSSADSDGDRVYVGGFGSAGLVVGSYWDGHRHGDIAVAAAWKFN